MQFRREVESNLQDFQVPSQKMLNQTSGKNKPSQPAPRPTSQTGPIAGEASELIRPEQTPQRSSTNPSELRHAIEYSCVTSVGTSRRIKAARRDERANRAAALFSATHQWPEVRALAVLVRFANRSFQSRPFCKMRCLRGSLRLLRLGRPCGHHALQDVDDGLQPRRGRPHVSPGQTGLG